MRLGTNPVQPFVHPLGTFRRIIGEDLQRSTSTQAAVGQLQPLYCVRLAVETFSGMSDDLGVPRSPTARGTVLPRTFSAIILQHRQETPLARPAHPSKWRVKEGK